jgi:hypothetical protein
MAEVEDVAGKTAGKMDPGGPSAAEPAIPFFGKFRGVVDDRISVVKAATAPQPDRGDIALGVSTLATDTTAFIQSSADTVKSIATDPLGWLVGQGLNFLISVVQPIQDAIHFVSGDGPALAKAAGQFGEIAKGLDELAKNFGEVADSSLAGWKGEAADTARTSLGDFAHGVHGVAGKSGDLAQVLQISSMLMSFIEDLIKAILTELITWLIMTWVPAMLAAVPSFGASTAAAGAASGAKVASTAGKTTAKVSKLRKLLQDVLEWLKKLVAKLKDSKAGKAFAESKAVAKTKAATGEAGKRFAKAGVDPDKLGGDDLRGLVQTGVKESLKKVPGAAIKGAIGADPTNPGDSRVKYVNDVYGKFNSYAKDGKKIAGYGKAGADQSTEKTEEDLDF